MVNKEKINLEIDKENISIYPELVILTIVSLVNITWLFLDKTKFIDDNPGIEINIVASYALIFSYCIAALFFLLILVKIFLSEITNGSIVFIAIFLGLLPFIFMFLFGYESINEILGPRAKCYSINEWKC